MNGVCDGTVVVLIRAADTYERALSLRPDNAEVCGFLACAYHEQG